MGRKPDCVRILSLLESWSGNWCLWWSEALAISCGKDGWWSSELWHCVGSPSVKEGNLTHFARRSQVLAYGLQLWVPFFSTWALPLGPCQPGNIPSFPAPSLHFFSLKVDTCLVWGIEEVIFERAKELTILSFVTLYTPLFSSRLWLLNSKARKELSF